MSPRKTTVAAVQMTSTGDVEKNLATAERLCLEAARLGSELTVLPECFAFLGPEREKLYYAEPLPGGGPILERFARLAGATGAELILGGFWESADRPDRVRNACVHLGRDGSVRAVYRKIHLFDVELSDGTVLRESDTVQAGHETVVTDAPFGVLGLSVCYDIRFPELYRQLVDRGAVALAVPAAFTRFTGQDHWHVLVRARAIESQAYVIAAAQFGHHYGPRVSYGHALVCDPWGRVLAECEDGEGVITAVVDPALVESVRAEVPSLRHRRLVAAGRD